MPDSPPSVALLVLNWNGRSLLERCLPPLLAQDFPDFQLLLVDNASDDESVAYVQQSFPAVEIIQNAENLGFARGINVGLRHLQSRQPDYVILLNNDVFVPAGWLAAFVAAIEPLKNLGVAGCKLLFPDGNIQHLGAEMTWPLAEGRHFHFKEPNHNHSTAITDVDYVTGAAFAITRKALAAVPLFDEQFYPFYLEEVDYCYQVRNAGLRVAVIPTVEAIHAESSSMKKVSGLQSRALFLNRLRFVLKHYSHAQFIEEFVSAEKDHLETLSANDLYYWREAVTEILFELTALSAENIAEKQAALLELRQHHLRTLNPSTNTAVVNDADGKLSQLSKLSNITEFDFTSSNPIIAKLRTTWHDVAGRWALRYVIQQQNQFNAHIMQMFGENLKVPEVSGQENGRLLEELLQLKQRVSELEQQLDKPSGESHN